jgi:serine/threonine protein kinase
VFRDVKPANVGFDSEGNLKLFDFGFCRELQEGESLHGKTGTELYMAPEVFLNGPYNMRADILYEVLRLEPHHVSPADLYERVILGGERSFIPRDWPKILADLIQLGWSPSPPRRPTMHMIHRILSQFLYKQHHQHAVAIIVSDDDDSLIMG